MNISDFASKQMNYTGAVNKVKWVIHDPDKLLEYLKQCNFKPGILKEKLDVSYATVKRWLCLANLWRYADIKRTGNKGGKKRTMTHDKFGYKLADSSYDYKNERGEIIRRYEHHIVAEIKYGRPLNDKEVIHHIDLDKKNNSPDNIFICNDNKHHRSLHGQLERTAGEAVRVGIIKFHPQHGYYLNNKKLVIED